MTMWTNVISSSPLCLAAQSGDAGKAASAAALAKQSSGASSPSRAQRTLSCIRSALRGPGFVHSTLFGITAGIATYGCYVAYRGCRVLLFDTETPSIRSRRRYAERQRLFLEDLSDRLAAHHIASLVPEYDPAALRMPFQSLDPKWRL